uniref:Uncharacterized protein n=1 Tax=Setaria viridis TaxID=4556 RepID=A0A4U6SXM2_SETVI|nr:hypothetical protein SEVIR_9G190850v2 [Setaria viridis]
MHAWWAWIASGIRKVFENMLLSKLLLEVQSYLYRSEYSCFQIFICSRFEDSFLGAEPASKSLGGCM